MSIRNIGVFAHVDAGKTTLTEQLLVVSGFLRKAGSVDKGTAYTDSLPVEKRRGITVKATCVSFRWKDAEIRLIDTPGHMDFSAEIERSFWALDAAVLVVDALKGAQPQTEHIFRQLKAQGLPFLIFVNKLDRPEADAEEALTLLKKRLKTELIPLWDEERLCELVCGTDDQLTEDYLNGEKPDREKIDAQLARLTRAQEAVPVLGGSALKAQGVRELLDAVVSYLPPADTSGQKLSAVVFAAASDPVMGRGAWIRVFGGHLENRMPVEYRAGSDPVSGEDVFVQRKITQIRAPGSGDTGSLGAGDIGLVYGLGDVKIGYVFGDGASLPRHVRPGEFRTPLITVQVTSEDPSLSQKLRAALDTLSGEDPLLGARYEKQTGEMHVQVMGNVQTEILGETLESRFGIKVRFGEPKIIYRETIRQRATGFVAYTMPKPCWAVIEVDIKPAPRGSGVRFASTVAARDILPRYQHQVKQALPKALSQGRLGWQVTDVEITLVGGSHHLIHTHPLDFIVATPMAVQDGLKRGGSGLLEPIYEFQFIVPSAGAGRVMSDVRLMRGEVTEALSEDDSMSITALVPVAESLNYASDFASATGGRGSISASLHSYRECDLSLGATCPRLGVDPLDTAKYILAARSALEGEIFD